jgi:hypothetical protein
MLRKVGCVGSKEVGAPQAASAIALRVQGKKVCWYLGVENSTLGVMRRGWTLMKNIMYIL